ncbi:hypothetical protein PRZ48_001955 [Zasmidium cellare]|uniref:Uncharacterized protein n=1 Tax=Zasmidium cellare TaxID=395010 RepID=A0ABR0F2X3_ZASCE|nr:hypothetical protein PRZ48_001955 [Zasmidium cellare]
MYTAKLFAAAVLVAAVLAAPKRHELYTEYFINNDEAAQPAGKEKNKREQDKRHDLYTEYFITDSPQ